MKKVMVVRQPGSGPEPYRAARSRGAKADTAAGAGARKLHSAVLKHTCMHRCAANQTSRCLHRILRAHRKLRVSESRSQRQREEPV